MATRFHIPSVGVYCLKGGRTYILVRLRYCSRIKIGSPFLGRDFILQVAPYMESGFIYQIERVKNNLLK